MPEFANRPIVKKVIEWSRVAMNKDRKTAMAVVYKKLIKEYVRAKDGDPAIKDMETLFSRLSECHKLNNPKSKLPSYRGLRR